MKRIRIRAVCAFRTFRQSPSAVWEFLAGLWLAAWLTVITWFAEGFQGFFVEQWIFTILYFLWPLGILTGTVSGDQSSHAPGKSEVNSSLLNNISPWLYYGFIVFITIGAVTVLSERYNWTFLRFELGSALLSSLVMPFFLYLVNRKLILGIALGTAIVVMLVANVSILLQMKGGWWTSSIVLFTALMLLAVPWSGLGLLLLHCAEKLNGRNRWGPFTEFISMTFLFVPLMYSVWVLGESLPDSATWQPVCVTVIGVLMSIIVSDPLKRFLKACWDPSSSA